MCGTKYSEILYMYIQFNYLYVTIKIKRDKQMMKYGRKKCGNHIVLVSFLSPPVQSARWALMRRFLSVCPSLYQNSLDKNSYFRKYYS